MRFLTHSYMVTDALQDVPPFTVVAGNPPRVVRGIYDDGRT